MNYTGMGFGGGFASGLANALAMKQQRDTQAKERQIANTWKSIGFLVDSGQVKDIADLQPHFDTLTSLGAFGDPKAQKKGQPSVQDHASAILGHILRQQPGQAGAKTPMSEVPDPVGPNDAGDIMPPGEPPLVGRSLSYPPVAPPMPRTLNGIPLLSPDEVVQQKIDRQGAQTTALIDLARNRIYPALKAADPTATLDDALAAVGVRLPRASAALGPKSIAGEVDGKPAFAVFVNGKYVDPNSGEPMTNFTPKTPAVTQNFGSAVNAKAKELFGKAPKDLTSEEMGQVEKAITQQAADTAGATTTARGKANAEVPLSSANRFQALRNLQEDWRKVDKPVKEVKRQFDVMQTGLRRFKQGDRNGGSQAVLVTFQKILDPNSVVRESEYARSAEGVGLLDRLLGSYEKLKSGGAGVPAAQLEEMVKTAKEFVDGLDEYNALERERISGAAKEAGLDPARVFGVASVDTDEAAPAAGGAPKSGGGAKTVVPGLYIDANGNLVTGAAPALPAMRPAVGHGAR